MSLQETCDGLAALNKVRNKLIQRQRHINQPAEQHFKADLIAELGVDAMTSEKFYALAQKVRKAALKVFRIEWSTLPDEEVEQYLSEALEKANTLTELEKGVSLGLVYSLKADIFSLSIFDPKRKAIEKQMELSVKELPVCEWWCSHRGCSFLGLATVIGEAGNLSVYSEPGKLWKRMGLAPYEKNGVTRAMGQWMRHKADLTKKEWEKAGYCPRRRASMFVIGMAIKMQKSGTYREIYDQEKAKKVEQKKGDKEWPPIRLDRHAQRYMEKRLLGDLWKQWNPRLVKSEEELRRDWDKQNRSRAA